MYSHCSSWAYRYALSLTQLFPHQNFTSGLLQIKNISCSFRIVKPRCCGCKLCFEFSATLRYSYTTRVLSWVLSSTFEFLDTSFRLDIHDHLQFTLDATKCRYLTKAKVKHKKAYGSVYVEIHSVLTSALDGGKWPFCFVPGKWVQSTPRIGFWMNHIAGLGAMKKIQSILCY
jgi:hypothetical protein